MVQGTPHVQTRLQVFDILDRLEALTNAATKLPLTNRAVVNPGELHELVGRLRQSLPKDISEAQQVLRFRDGVVTKAQADAKRIRDSAEQDSLAKISETQVMRDAQHHAEQVMEEAQRKAQDLLADAERQARERVDGADAYAADVLQKLEGELATLLATARRGLEMLSTGRGLAEAQAQRPQQRKHRA